MVKILTTHLKQSGCQSLSNALSLLAVLSPSLGAIGSWQPLQRGANLLQFHKKH